ncbi:PH domain-containing protein [Erythrobacter sp. BLCC-B19]|uniref:PH domain-containing protein n=1 Tax=Erythrobacter sp. BLCC-B19 TaxID=3025315 RepID=UPI002362E1D2|nr:PH domain-containing protein [Erythrobacter sp. BLCC-B19]WDA42086.1 PH domain-containing protein [Erythrobacter sp. BLCC-B19]
MSEPQRTAPLSVVLGGLGAIRSAIFPAIAIAFSGIGGGGRLWIALGVGLASAVIGFAFSYVGWRRTTYTIGAADIRVESGIFSRSARSVPYERIQDVSLEAKPIPRLLGLVAVKFETGAGGGDDLALEYLTAAQGEELRQVVRERRDEEAVAVAASGSEAAPIAPVEGEGEVLYALTPARLVTFGLFEFSLAVFAVLGGALQYLDNVSSIDVWDADLWWGWLKETGSTAASLGPYAQAAGALAGLFGLVVIGFATGVVRTVIRDWGFTLTRSARGFRRQRGLLTRTDVVMPAHRVQALVIGTGVLRYRFGWHGLSFVSLAQDAKDESHIVAPFARMEEIAPIASAAGFRLPGDATPWHRASPRQRTDSLVLGAGLFVLAAIPVALFAPPGVFLIPLGIAVFVAGASLYAWEFRRHAIDDSQIYASHGFLSPTRTIATRLKLHSVEIAQSPLARWRGYATLHLGLAGGTMAMRGVPLAEARAIRAAVLETISATDYSRLDSPAGAAT